MIKLKTPGEYRNAIKTLRKYARGFGASDGFDLRAMRNDTRYPPTDKRHYQSGLSAAQRRKVEKFFDVYQTHAAYKPAKFQRMRDMRKLKSAQSAMGMPTKGWKGVFVPSMRDDTPPDDIVMVEYPGFDAYGKPKMQWVIEYRTLGVDATYIPFDRESFAIYGTDYVRGLIDGLPNGFKYNIAFGEARERWKAGGTRDHILADLERIMYGYNGASGYSKTGDHYSAFITGLWVYRGAGWDEFNTIKTAKVKSAKEKRAQQEAIKKTFQKERRRLKTYQHDMSEVEYLKEKYPSLFKK